MLPDMDGFGVTRRLRDRAAVPVVFLTARDSLEDKITGLTVGGDDYVTKPFSLEEVVARIRAVLRRTGGGSADERPAGLRRPSLDEDSHEVRRGRRDIELTPTEFKLLRYLMLNPNRVLSKAQILDHVWDYDFRGETGIVESYISYLRRKVDADGAAADPHQARRRLRAAAAPGDRPDRPHLHPRRSRTVRRGPRAPVAAAAAAPARAVVLVLSWGPRDQRHVARSSGNLLVRDRGPAHQAPTGPPPAPDSAQRPPGSIPTRSPPGLPADGGPAPSGRRRTTTHARLPDLATNAPGAHATSPSPSAPASTATAVARHRRGDGGRPAAWRSPSRSTASRARCDTALRSARSRSRRGRGSAPPRTACGAPSAAGEVEDIAAAIAAGDLTRRVPERPTHRGRPPVAQPQRDARADRAGVRRPRGLRGADAPVRRRRQPRAAHAAGRGARLRRALPPGRGQRAGRRGERDAPDRGRGGPDGRARRGPAAAGPAGRGAAARVRRRST